MFDIITFGSASRDVFLELKNPLVKNESFKLELGAKLNIEKIYFSSGGGGTNSAFTFSNQGFKTAYCGMVGKDDTGDEILKELKEQGIDVSLISRTDLKPSNYSIVVNHPEKDRTILAYRGASSLIKKIDWSKMKSSWFYIAPFKNNELFGEILEFASDNNIKVAVNPGMKQLKVDWKDWVKKIDIIFVNEKEMAILKEKLNGFEGILNVTKGPKGVSTFFKEKSFEKKAPNSKVADRTGAGDSYASGFVSEYIRSKNIEKAMDYGILNATSCLKKIGAKQGLLKK